MMPIKDQNGKEFMKKKNVEREIKGKA